MEASSIPVKFPIPWANSAGGGFVRVIPVASQIGTNPGAASLTDGFPPLTFLDTDVGGIPPDGRDGNGIVKQITQWNQWQQAGAPIAYDSAFSTAIGGYPIGTMLSSGTSVGAFWLSIADNNTSDPDTGGANWIGYSVVHGSQVISSSTTFTVPAGVVSIEVWLWGGGGGGGGAYNLGYSSGGTGGGFCYGRFTVVPGSVYSVTIGTGGAGGNGSPSNGTAGGTSNFGALLGAPGGPYGLAANNFTAGASSSGTMPTGGQLNIGGQVGGPGLAGVGGGSGGQAPMGGGSAPCGITGGTGALGLFPASGGSGTGAASATGEAGGPGAGGLCIIKW